MNRFFRLKVLRLVGSPSDGLTSVEILMALLVIAVLAIAGATLISRGQIETGAQKYKRAAIEMANTRMEQVVRVWSYSSVAGLVGHSQATNVVLNHTPGFGMTTTVVNAGSGGDNCLKVAVSVAYQKNGNAVTLETYRSK
jgi:type II secretory pathway pseudopilin PulG